MPSNMSWLSSPFKKYIACLNGEIIVNGKKDNTHSTIILTPTDIYTKHSELIKYNDEGNPMLIIDNNLLHQIENISPNATIMSIFENNLNLKKITHVEHEIFGDYDYDDYITKRIIRNGGL
jgi:hypothetical protein